MLVLRLTHHGMVGESLHSRLASFWPIACDVVAICGFRGDKNREVWVDRGELRMRLPGCRGIQIYSDLHPSFSA